LSWIWLAMTAAFSFGVASEPVAALEYTVESA
jgi:hypothetical protein